MVRLGQLNRSLKMANNPTPLGITITDQWLDLYVASGLPVGEQLVITCRGSLSVYLAESLAAPSLDLQGVELYPTRQLIVDEDSIGLWARTSTANKPSLIIVQKDNIN